MDEELKQRIRVRAHEIWMNEGRPHGRDQDHWDQAFRELSASGGAAAEAVETQASAGAAAKSGRGGRSKKAPPGSTASDAASTAGESASGRRR
ncbi:hypothetical protein GCM10007036_20440 [Alsobacter metallidurans]|uniref:DUF2934 domain-containing protein n=1 Tax=Alsobacter metallidurans TaxID=340221 RepID=A0A917MI14_9HYPH|nr:DUF2934 domain-containing protein [Alsobacter metallidurans]GGH18345.1 hypothetical protein GCM10007036_20440 [Alsobacter metallidurans]